MGKGQALGMERWGAEKRRKQAWSEGGCRANQWTRGSQVVESQGKCPEPGWECRTRQLRRKSLEAKLWGKQPRPDEALRIHRSTRGSQVADAQGKLAEPYRARRTLRSTRGSQVAKSWVKRPGLDGVGRTHRSRRRRFLLARVVNELVPNLLTGVNDEKKMCVTL